MDDSDINTTTMRVVIRLQKADDTLDLFVDCKSTKEAGFCQPLRDVQDLAKVIGELDDRHLVSLKLNVNGVVTGFEKAVLEDSLVERFDAVTHRSMKHRIVISIYKPIENRFIVVDTRHTVLHSLFGERAATTYFRIAKKFRFWIICSLIGPLFWMFLTIHMGSKGLRDATSENWNGLYLVGGVLNTFSLFHSVALSQSSLLVKALFNFEVFYILLMGTTGSVFASYTFNDFPRSFCYSSQLMSGIYAIACVDALHRSVTTRWQSAIRNLASMTGAFLAMSLWYFNGDQLQAPINTKPVTSWEVGGRTVNLYAGTFLLTSLVYVVLFSFLVLRSHWKNPDQLVFLRPYLSVRSLNDKESITIIRDSSSKLRFRTMNEPQDKNMQAVPKCISRADLIKVLNGQDGTLGVCVLPDSEGLVRLRFGEFAKAAQKKVLERLQILSGQGVRQSSINAIIRNTNEMKLRILKVSDVFDREYTINFHNTILAKLAGPKWSFWYFKLSKRFQLSKILTFFTATTYAWALIALVSPRLRSVLNDDIVALVSFVFCVLLSIHIGLLLNASLLRLLLREPEVYFHIGSATISFVSTYILFQGKVISYTMLGYGLIWIFVFAFHDASGRKGKAQRYDALLGALLYFFTIAIQTFAASSLDWISEAKALLHMKLVGMDVSINIFTASVSFQFVLILYTINFLYILFTNPDCFILLKGEFLLQNESVESILSSDQQNGGGQLGSKARVYSLKRARLSHLMRSSGHKSNGSSVIPYSISYK